VDNFRAEVRVWWGGWVNCCQHLTSTVNYTASLRNYFGFGLGLSLGLAVDCSNVSIFSRS
jgi:hypothetical protein